MRNNYGFDFSISHESSQPVVAECKLVPLRDPSRSQFTFAIQKFFFVALARLVYRIKIHQSLCSENVPMIFEWKLEFSIFVDLSLSGFRLSALSELFWHQLKPNNKPPKHFLMCLLGKCNFFLGKSFFRRHAAPRRRPFIVAPFYNYNLVKMLALRWFVSTRICLTTLCLLLLECC